MKRCKLGFRLITTLLAVTLFPGMTLAQGAVDLTTASGVLAALSSAKTQEQVEEVVRVIFEMATIDDIAFCKEMLSDTDISDLATSQLKRITVSNLGTFFKSLVDVFKMGDPEGVIEITESFDEILLDLQTQVNAAYKAPTDPANALFIFMTTSGPVIPDRAPSLSAETPLTSIQTTLFSTWLIHSHIGQNRRYEKPPLTTKFEKEPKILK